MNRFSSAISLGIGTTAAATDALIFGEYTMGFLHVPTGSSLTAITWKSCATKDGTYLDAYDKDGAQITQTVSDGKSYEIPPSLAGAAFLKPVGNVAEEVTIALKA